MAKTSLILAAALALAGTSALADCREELAALQGEGVSKEGAMAPLSDTSGATPQTGGDGTAAAPKAAGAGEGVAKDGSQMPLGADPGVATSAQDAQAQQTGGDTAAEQAMGSAGGGDARAQAISRAEAALAQGDEEACMEALEEARGH
jgi:hypothetical protein